jgi:hypothetical protein
VRGVKVVRGEGSEAAVGAGVFVIRAKVGYVLQTVHKHKHKYDVSDTQVTVDVAV